MTFSDQIRHTILFKKVGQKGRESEINYIKIFHNAKTLSILVGNVYSDYQFMHNLLEISGKVKKIHSESKQPSRIEERIKVCLSKIIIYI